MNNRILTLLASPSILLFAGCEADNSASDFERRFVLVEIPGFEAEDFAELLDHDDPNARYLAVANLTAAGALNEIAEDDEDSKTGDFQTSLTKRVRALLKDNAPKVRAIAVHAPSNQTGEKAESDLIALLADDTDAVRVEALAGLANLEALSDAAIDAILSQLDDENLLVRLHAAAAIGTSCPQIKRETVSVKLTESMPEREIAEQLVIFQSLAALGTRQGEQLVFEKLQSDDPRFVRAAAGLIPEMKSDSIEAALLAALERESPLSEMLLELLSKVATEKSFATGQELLADDSRELRDYGRAVLKKIGTEEARITLLDAYHQLTPKVEAQFSKPTPELDEVAGEHAALLEDITALSTKLGRLPPDPEAMAKLLSTGGAVEKRMVLQWLRKNRFFDLDVLNPDAAGTDFTKDLVSLAKDDSAILRSDACMTLAHSADSRVEEILVSALSDPVTAVRRSALESAVKHAVKTANHDLLGTLHARRDEFTPSTWNDEDPDLEIRFSLEQAVTELEAEWMSRERYLKDLEPENNNVTRLLAAFLLREDEVASSSAAEVLLEFLAEGTASEKAFAAAVAVECLSDEHRPRLREIANSEQDEELKAQLEALIDEVSD